MEWQPLALSFQFAAIATVVAALVGIAVAALLTRRFPGRDVLDVLVTMPLVLPPTVLGYYLLVAFGNRSFIGKAFYAVFGTTIVFTKTGAILAATIGALPLVVKTGRAALEGVDANIVRAARTLGAGPFRAFVTIQLPLAARGLIAALMLGFARSLGDFGVTLMVAGDIPGETQTSALAIYGLISAHRDNEALGMVFVQTTIALLLLYPVTKLTARRDG